MATRAALVGTGLWAWPLFAALPAATPAGVALAAVSLLVSVGATIGAAISHRRAEGWITVIGSGAILGAGVPVTQLMLFLASGRPIAAFDDIAFAGAISLASSLSVTAFFARRVVPGPEARIAAIVALFAVGLSSAALTAMSVGQQVNMVPAALAIGVCVVLGVLAVAGLSLRRATTAPAALESSPPSP